jgi:hypothetical protein
MLKFASTKPRINTVVPSPSMQRMKGKIREVVRGLGLNGKPALKATAMQNVPSLTKVFTGGHVCVCVCVYHAQAHAHANFILPTTKQLPNSAANTAASGPR